MKRTTTEAVWCSFEQLICSYLDRFAAAGAPIRLWWRDDDAVAPTPALDRLLAIARQYGVEPGIAVIPAATGAALAARLVNAGDLWVLQHGHSHTNWQPKGAKAAELGDARMPDAVLADLTAGADHLRALFGGAFLPVLVPPWNRIAPAVARRRREAGLYGLSTFTWTTRFGPHHAQAHVDIISWKRERRFIGLENAAKRFDLQLARRLNNPHEPLGLLTHHLGHTGDMWDFLDRFLALTCAHPGATWPPVSEIFDLTPSDVP